MFRTPERDVHVHLYGLRDPEIARVLLLRDHLRRHAGDRQLYESAKRTLATRHWCDANDYADAKSPVIAEILLRASRRADDQR